MLGGGTAIWRVHHLSLRKYTNGTPVHSPPIFQRGQIPGEWSFEVEMNDLMLLRLVAAY